ncbi:MAG: nitroreductase family protein [Acinetobacter populi]|uniref:nitroreductase family protein n=1 Tax=Acinetobacter populi TaxID=1582270 RepID=UPI0023576A4D|nr:nitroreductase family protein [Acinetobacter populi]MCH4249079.1 nitroreductase family protein [Acinetobacter populi]
MTKIQPLLQQRYGNAQALPDVLQDTDLSKLDNLVLTTLLSHASLRHFSDRAIDVEILSVLIAAAQSASTSSNLQAWSVIAVQDPAHKAKLSELAAHQAFIREAPLFLIWTIDLHRSTEVIELAQPNGGVEQALGLESVDSLLIGTIDAALAAQNLTVAARSLGLGTVYVGAIRNNLQDITALLKLPQGVIPVFGLAVGYPQDHLPQAIKPRLPQQIILHPEVYQKENTLDETALSRYEEILHQFQGQVGQVQDRWRDKVLQRLSALNGRERLAEAFNQQGLNVFTEK